MTEPVETVVSTREELERAVASGVGSVRVSGELAEAVPGAFLIRRHAMKTLVALGAALSAVRVPGLMGLSMARSIAALAGVDVALVRAVSTLGPGLATELAEGWEMEERPGKSERIVLKRVRKQEPPLTP